MPDRQRLLGDLSWLQIVVGALAAMTSAWIASTLGVGGTIIGAAIGSLVIPISSALYGRTLDKGRVLVVRTERGTVIQQQVDGSSDTEIVDEVADANPNIRDAAVVTQPPRLHWKTILLTTVAVLALAVVAMGAYELVSGQAYGGRPDNARIGNPFGGATGNDEPPPVPTATAPTSIEPTAAPTPTDEEPSPTPTEPTPATDEPTIPTG
ncbi:MAG: hypothetical protein WCB95_04335 [Aeromicrobium sp.]